MKHYRQSFVVKFGCFCMTASLLFAGQSLADQTTARAQVKDATQPKTATLATRATLDKEAQLRAAIKRCGAACRVGGTGSIAAPGSGPLEYNCDENGNCACFGAQDCVKMTDVCKEGTMGCNDQGCICEEDTSGG